MSNIFDENNEEEKQEQKLYEFYEVFSLEVRRQLLAKNIPIIQSVYDVLYPKTKDQMLAKNVAGDITIDNTAESVRNALIAKIVEENIDLEKISEDFRNSLLSRNILAQSSFELNSKIDRIRQSLLSKNKNSNPNTIDDTSSQQRENLLSKNVPKLGEEERIQKDNELFREGNLHKNVLTENNLDSISEDIRKSNIHKNIDNESDLESQSDRFRENNLHKNVAKNPLDETNAIDKVADQQRMDSLNKNVLKESNLEESSEDLRNSSLSKNVEKESSLSSDSEIFRSSNISNNVSDDSDLLSDSEKIRKSDLSKNVASSGDLLTDSEGLRIKDLAKNIPSESNLLDSSVKQREEDLSKNMESESNLLNDSKFNREDSLSKNTPTKNDLVGDSKILRDDLLSKNVVGANDLLNASNAPREDALSKNVQTEGDLFNESSKLREDILSKNEIIDGDLLKESEFVRNDILSKNISTESDLLTLGEQPREDLLSANVPNPSDLLTLGEQPRIDLLSANVPNPSDLLTRAEQPREDLLSANVPNPSDLLQLGEQPREDLLSANVPNPSDLLQLGEQPREGLLASNIPNPSDLLVDSYPYFVGNISANVPNATDLLQLAEQPRENLLSSNVPNQTDLLQLGEQPREDLLSANVPVSSDLLQLGEQPREDLLSSNIPNSSDLLAESLPIRNDLIAQNIISDSNLYLDSSSYRENLLSKNPNTDLGFTFEGLGTFSYLGLSKVAAQGLIIRTFLQTKNKPNLALQFDNVNAYPIGQQMLGRNDYVLYKNDYNRTDAKTLTSQLDARGNDLVGYPNTYFDGKLKDSIERQFGENRFYTETYQSGLQKKYGLASSYEEEVVSNMTLGGGFYGVNTLHPQGGEFSTFGNPGKAEIFNIRFIGSMTEASRKYNLSKNLYNLQGIQAVTSTAEYIQTLKSNNDLGFQDLINKTIGSFSDASDSISAQQYGNLIPRAVLNANNFLYLRMSAEKMLRANEPTDPKLKDAWIGTPESMMAKTIAGNPLEEQEFKTGARGLKYVMKTIRNNKDVPMSVNYDPQNTNKYVIGQTGSEVKYSRQRFTIRNPHSPTFARSLIFSLKNYSSGQDYYLPPYIESFSDSHSANWNEINFLGRPEPIYTYNNSNREGNITFVVLTDYSERVLLGRKYDEDGMNKVVKDIVGVHFSDKQLYNVRDNDLDFGYLDKKVSDDNEARDEMLKQNQVNNASTAVVTTGDTESTIGDAPENVENNENLLRVNADNLNVEGFKAILEVTKNKAFDYNAASDKNKNIYDFMTNTVTTDVDGQLITTPGDTLKRLDEMVSNLSFQPAFFSGDKIDFLRRMDFLAKLTKPAKADECSGFSFTKPPVAHIKLGDWWDHDIVVKSVSVDYSDSPWALDGGDDISGTSTLNSRVQPLWAKVTLSFNFVGRFGGEGAPVLSTDNGGVYSRSI